MKNLVYLVAFVALISCKENTTLIEDSPAVAAPGAEANSPTDSSEVLQTIESVADIQKEYTRVTSNIQSGKMDSTSFSYNCNVEKKGTVTYFSETGQLRMIKHRYNEYSHFSATEQYVVKDSALFFVLQSSLAWSFVDQNQTKDNVTENRIYIIDSKPVKCLQKKFTVYSNTKDAPQADTVPNKEIECAALEPISDKFALLLKYANREEELACLGD